VGGLLANLVVTIGLTFVSVHNYPGGDAIRALRELGSDSGHTGTVRSFILDKAAQEFNRPTFLELRVFLPPSVLQTGASRYTLEQDIRLNGPIWEFNRTESEWLQTPGQLWSAGFDYVITDETDRFVEAKDGGWVLERSVESFAGVALKPSFRIKWRPALSILSRGPIRDGA
jgi:hypothetical protein